MDWIVENYKPGQPLHVTVICTGNSRRSILGATMGNIAAAYYGMPEIRFHSGGTAPTAFNPRTIAALKEIGVEIEPTGTEAARGEPKTANPIYQVRWGESGEPAMESDRVLEDLLRREQSPSRASPPSWSAARPMPPARSSRGPSPRISMPYLDPKIYDDSRYESRKYAERRDDIGRLMLCVMMQARNRLMIEPPTDPRETERALEEISHVRNDHPGREGKIRIGRHQRAVHRPRRREGRGRGVRLYARRARLDPRRGQHGALMRQPHGLRQPAGRARPSSTWAAAAVSMSCSRRGRSGPRAGPSAST